jgi:iron complex transport system substrate-binding protein
MDVRYARRFRAVSGSAEEILALRPDVVIAGEFMPPTTVAALQRTGVRLVRLPIASTVAESEEQVATIARLVGHPERGQTLDARIEAALARAAPPAAKAPITAVVWEPGGIVPGDNTLVAELLRRTGFVNFSAARGMRQADVLPLETMLADPPRVIFAAGDPRTSEDRMLAHPALGALRGTLRVRFDPSLLWCGGPTLIRGAERLAEIRERLRAEGR